MPDLTRDLTRSQIRILFELSNGKRLLVVEHDCEAYICADDEMDTPVQGTAADYANFRSLRESDCLLREEHRVLASVGAVDVYGISGEGIERLLDSSLRPEEG
jgi:hypothetical protein